MLVLGEMEIVIGVYVNGFIVIWLEFLKKGSSVFVLFKWIDFGFVVYVDYVVIWIELGVMMVGGCCEVGLLYIGELVCWFGDFDVFLVVGQVM